MLQHPVHKIITVLNGFSGVNEYSTYSLEHSDRHTHTDARTLITDVKRVEAEVEHNRVRLHSSKSPLPRASVSKYSNKDDIDRA